ncbi:DNA transfer protein, partial [Salmonella enterica subsp. enterica serovar Infantis]
IQQLSTLEGQGNALTDYYGSTQFKNQADQLSDQALNSAAATGGLGSTATTNSLAAIAPTLGQTWLSGQMQNYGNLLNVG